MAYVNSPRLASGLATARATVPACVRALVLAAIALPLQLAAQAASGARTIVTLSDSMPVANAQAVVLFHSPPSGDNVILLPRRTVSPNALGAALRVLRKLEKEHGDSPHSAMIPIEGVLPPRDQTPGERASLRSIIAEVAQQPMTRVGRLGMGQWMSLSASQVQLR